MITLSGKISNKFGVASSNLAPDIARINAEVSSLGIVLVTGTFNVDLDEDSSHEKPIDEIVFTRSYSETLFFERCRLKLSKEGSGVRCLLLRSSIHKNSEFKKTLELMSSCHLRNTYGLKAGGSIYIEIQGDGSWWNQTSQLADNNR